MSLQVGEVVRIPKGSKRTGRATITTVNGEHVDLLWEDAAPAPGIVTPKLPPTTSGNDEEVTVSRSEIMPLYSFENDASVSEKEAAGPSSVWKDRGDTLLKIGDAASAVPYYERALRLTSKIQIGSAVLLVSKDGDAQAAEVDCMEDDTAEIAYLESGKDAVVKVKDIRLSISLKESEMQVRLLLNLARCLMQLAGFDNDPLSRPTLYRQGAVTACSLAYAILSQGDEDDVDTNLLATSLLLRSKAQASRARWQPAIKDVEDLLKLNPQSKEGRIWRKELQKLIVQQEKANKKLVKGMCQWIQKTTNEGGEDGAPVSDDDCSVAQTTTPAATTTTTTPRTDSFTYWIPSVLILLVALWMHQNM